MADSSVSSETRDRALEQARDGAATASGVDDNDQAPSTASAVAASASPAGTFPAEEGAAAAPSGVAQTVDRKQFFKLFTIVMLPMFLAAIDQTMLATAMPVISREFSGLQDSSWLAVSYLLASIVVVPLYGQLGDHHGRRRMLLAAIVVFLAGSLSCGFAGSMAVLPASRVLQCFGGGGLMTLSHALIGEVVPPRERARYQAYFAIVFTVASVGGPVLGGLIVEHANWRWLFLGNLPLCLIAVWRLVPMIKEDRKHPRPGKMHLTGALLFALAVTLSLFWLTSAGHRFDWLSGTSIGLVVACGVLWTVLIYAERRVARPFLPIDLLPLKTVRYAAMTVCCFASVMFAMVFFLPMYFQITLGSGAAESGLLLLPFTAGVVSGATLSSRMVLWTGRPKIIPTIGLSLAAVCLIGLTLASANRPLLTGLGYLTGVGVGSVMSVMQIVTQIAAGPSRLGGASATLALARSLGAAVGAAAFGALIFALIDADNALTAAADPAMREQVAFAFHVAFLCAAAVCLLGAWLASRVPEVRFDKELSVADAVSH
ncbi:MDR family MFS transporter [soil metagenome]